LRGLHRDDFIDETVLHRINDVLGKHDDTLVWRFPRTFDRHVSLPKRIESATGIDVRTRWGKVRVTESALVLAVSFDVRAVGAETLHAAE
jgi:hypothetical protein